MHFITGKHMPRRTFIRGAMGAAVALPFLDAMVAAKGAGAKATAAADRTRLICIEEVHGLAGCNKWGASKLLYAPAETGSMRWKTFVLFFKGLRTLCRGKSDPCNGKNDR
jgi:hypothetical protein